MVSDILLPMGSGLSSRIRDRVVFSGNFDEVIFHLVEKDNSVVVPSFLEGFPVQVFNHCCD